MQYVRMSLAYSATNPQEVVDATKDTPERKVTEMKYALQVEKELHQGSRSCERYLNMAPFGNGAYGVYAASQVYFSKKPKDLTVGRGRAAGRHGQGADRLRPDHRRPATRRPLDRRDYVIDNMRRPRLHHPGSRPTEAKAVKLGRTSQARRQRLRLGGEEQLGLLLRLLLPLVAEPGGVRQRRRTTGSAS